MSVAADVIPLPYEPVVARWRSRRVRRVALIALVLVAGAAGGMWGPDAWGRAHRLYLQRRCLAYEPATSGRVVYDEDQSAIVDWLRAPAHPPRSSRPTATVTAAPMPRAWADLRPRVVFPTPGYPGQFVNDPAPRTCLFLHERAAPGGERRLLAVELLSDPRAGVPSLVCHAVRPSSWAKPPAAADVETDGSEVCRLGGLPAKNLWFSPGAWRRLRAFEGRPDPVDPTRLTIPFEIDGVRLYAHGRVCGDDWEIEWTVQETE